jgi:hypothetical protein
MRVAARAARARGRVLVSEHCQHRPPQPGQPFGCPKRGEHGDDERLAADL